MGFRYSNFSCLFFTSSYECGFVMMLHMASNFSSSVMRLLIFFILLDIEVVLLLGCIGFDFYDSFWISGYYFFFVTIILFGFIYEISCNLVIFD
uniref:NADH dehydrogenase subunit 3 n=1 Tax=Paradiplozoon yunnanensis TaxID=2268894 RepID=UPI001FAECB23|nr:NADH dehydrogenase subunit 3 [Paradiplozoon yunnanensis]UKP90073.1 NADH dehydrogenase subunit 3 [Paradiplozoon yunnanensis]